MRYKINFFKAYGERLLTEIINISPSIFCLIALLLFRKELPNNFLSFIYIFLIVLIEIVLSYFNFYANARIEIGKEGFLLIKKNDKISIRFTEITEIQYDVQSYRKFIPQSINLVIVVSNQKYILTLKNVIQTKNTIMAKIILKTLLSTLSQKVEISKLMSLEEFETFKTYSDVQ
jgi:hypothetical protein